MSRVTLRGALHLPVNTLALRRGGLVKAVMLRANALAKDAGREVVIEVLACQPRLAEDVAELVREGHLDRRVHVRSVLRALDPSLPSPGGDDPVLGCVHRDHAAVPTPSRFGAPVVRPVDDPRAVALAEPPITGRRLHPRIRPGISRQDAEGRPKQLETVDALGRRVARTEYGSGDRAVRIQHFRPGDAQPVQHRWLGEDGRCYLTVWQDPGSTDWTTSCLAVDGSLRSVSGMAELYRLAFQRLLAEEQQPVLFSEFREGLPNIPGGFDPVVVAIEHPSLHRIAVLHSNHALQGQQRLPKRSSPKFTALLEGVAQWDRLVVATEHQRAEIVAQYGSEDHVAAIPHYGPIPAAGDSGTYDPNRFVLVARIHKKKRVDEAIEAFRLVVDENPDARLEVYGFGYGDALERETKALVEKRELTEQVRFQGFAADVASIYRGACASIQTSQSEGFGMALMESLAHGVPVVAYDVDYGAREVVRDGVDGYVVPWGDRGALAGRMLELSRDADLRGRLSAAGPGGAARFSRDRYVREWQELLDGLPQRNDARIVDGRLQLSGAPADALVLRARDGSAEDVEVPFTAGTAQAALPEVAVNGVVDVYFRRSGELSRTPCSGAGPSDDDRWRLFVTEFGNLSVRRVPVARTRPPAGAVSVASRLPARARASSRRVLRGLRTRFGRVGRARSG